MHYNIKSLEKEGTTRTYKAVFDYEKINERFCAFILVAFSSSECPDPESIPKALAAYKEVESTDLVTGESELVAKVRTKDQDDYYNFLRNVLSQQGILRTMPLTSLRQFKNEFISLWILS